MARLDYAFSISPLERGLQWLELEEILDIFFSSGLAIRLLVEYPDHYALKGAEVTFCLNSTFQSTRLEHNPFTVDSH